MLLRGAHDVASIGGGIVARRQRRTGPYIEASERGLDFAIAGGPSNGMAQVVIAGKNYKTVEALRGAAIGASSLTSSTVTALKEALKQ